MVRRLALGMLVGVLACAAARAAGDEPPPLAPPAEWPSASTPHPSSGAATSVPLPAGPQPVLAVPGLSRSGPASSRPAALQPAPENAVPPLTGPAGAPALPDAPSARTPRTRRFDVVVPGESSGLSRSVRESGPPALTLEPVPADRLKSEATAKPAPGLSPDEGPTPSRPVAPARRTWLGRLAPPAGVRPADDEPIRVTPRSDPATEAALKRRLEAQIRTAAGPQLRALNVRVTGRTVEIQARVYHFWQKRLVRRSIESLPHPPGYQTRIDVTD